MKKKNEKWHLKFYSLLRKMQYTTTQYYNTKCTMFTQNVNV